MKNRRWAPVASYVLIIVSMRSWFTSAVSRTSVPEVTVVFVTVLFDWLSLERPSHPVKAGGSLVWSFHHFVFIVLKSHYSNEDFFYCFHHLEVKKRSFAPAQKHIWNSQQLFSRCVLVWSNKSCKLGKENRITETRNCREPSCSQVVPGLPTETTC